MDFLRSKINAPISSEIVEFENMQFTSFRGQLLSFKSRDELTLKNLETLESTMLLFKKKVPNCYII